VLNIEGATPLDLALKKLSFCSYASEEVTARCYTCAYAMANQDFMIKALQNLGAKTSSELESEK
jgi:hypothetical protein